MFHKLRTLLDRRRTHQEFDDEVNQHIGLLADRYVSRGMPRDEALHAARRQFGNVTALKEIRNEMQTSVWLETSWQDVRYAVRSLAKNKGFTAVAILTLALGIGANTAIFSVVNAAIVRPLPFPDASRLVVLWGNVKRVVVERRGASYPDFCDWRSQSRSFDAMAAYDPHAFVLSDVDSPERISGEFVSQPYFSLLGIHAALGRTFTPDEDRVPQRDAVVFLSDGFWKRRFGADPAIVGRSIQLDGRAYTVVGVAPAGFRGLSDSAEVWAPFVMSDTARNLAERGNVWFVVLARLHPGVSLKQAQVDLDAVSHRLARAYPGTEEGRGVEAVPLASEAFGAIRKPLLIVLAAVIFVLLIAASNVANLLLARSDARRQEVAMRAALGASRWRLARQLLTESAVLVALGSSAGVVCAHYGVRALMAASPLNFPTFIRPTADMTVCLFTVLICCAVALVLGLVPAVHLRDIGESVKQAGGRALGATSGSRFRDAIVVAETSVSLLLLIAAGLMIRTVLHLSTLDPGYDPTHVINMRISLPQFALSDGSDTPDAKTMVVANDILRRVSTLPSVQSASVGSDAPLTDSMAIYYTAEGEPPVDTHNMPRAYIHRVSPDFFRTLRVRFVEGRSFSADEAQRGASVAVVTENLVRRFWPGQDPLGKRIREGRPNSSNKRWLTIIGVVQELKYRGLPQNPTADPDLFQVFNQGSRDFALLVRTSLPPASMLSAITKTLHQTDPSILIYDAGPLENLLGHETARSRFTGWLLALF
ncbi:MAG TPA: ABC transporter permease, partial [Bryobacteraceae bacterium]|nr:ABC transporter permease [Bryobacteraceae bacterium]